MGNSFYAPAYGKSPPASGLVLPFLLLIAEAAATGNHDLPLDRPFTSLNAEPALMEREMARQIRAGSPMSFLFPRPCLSSLDSSRVCGEPGRFSHVDSLRGREISLSSAAGIEARGSDEIVGAFEGGVLSWGRTGPISFFLDARMFTELHEDGKHASYDREFVEKQDESQSGSLSYTSYSRFRSNVGYDWSWGRLTVGRDAAHWGPGLFGNMAFHQDAVPFNQVNFTSHLGPLTVRSLYGRLAPRLDWEMDTSLDFRSVYAHRYEWRVARNLLLGISEQMIVYKREAPFAFNPLVPLYIAKAVEMERLNNGNISFDAFWRFPGLGAVYSEFLIDDIQSPTALFDDQWGNKWGWLAGFHLIRNIRGRLAGLVAEYSRVEPWVYTHYIPGTAQTAHFGHPLGNPLGPNSQSATAKAYWREDGHWYLALRSDLVWKGRDPGSSVLDIHGLDNGSDKSFLHGFGRPKLRVRPHAAAQWRGFGIHIEADLGRQPRVVGRLQFNG